MRNSAFGEPRDEDSVGSVDEGCVALAASDAEAQSLSDLFADQRRVECDFVNDIGAALQEVRGDLLVERWFGMLSRLLLWNLNWSWNDFCVLLVEMIDGDFSEFAVLEEYWVADDARHLARDDENENCTARLQHFNGVVVIRVFDRHSIDSQDFVAYAESRQICRSTFGNSRNKNSLVVAFERRRSAATCYAQAEPSRCAFDVDFQALHLLRRQGVCRICGKERKVVK